MPVQPFEATSDHGRLDRGAGTGRFMAKDQETAAQIESARAALAESESQLASARADLDSLSALENYAHITAPFAGVVTKRYATPRADSGGTIRTRNPCHWCSWRSGQVAAGCACAGVGGAAAATGNHGAGSCVGDEPGFEGHVARFADALNDETRHDAYGNRVENADGTLKRACIGGKDRSKPAE